MVFCDASSQTYGGVIDGSGTVTKSGSGVLILTGASTYTGGTTISQGTLWLGDGTTNGSVVGNITDNGTLRFVTAEDESYGGIISGTGSVWESGDGTLTLSGANTYAGNTMISGTIVCGGDNCLPTGSHIIMRGGVLDLGGYNQALSTGLLFAMVSGGVVQDGTLIFNGSSTDTAISTTSASGTINAAIDLQGSSAAEYWSISSGYTLAIGGNVDFTGKDLYICGSGTAVFSGTSYTGAQLGVTDDSVATFSSGDLTTTAGTLAGCCPDETYDARGTINWNSSGTLTPGGLLAVGQGADGTFTQSDGTVDTTASGCTLAIGSSGGSGTEGVYNLDGGVLEACSPMGYNAGAQLNLAGGTLQPAADFALPSGSVLTYTLVGGTTSTVDTGSNNVTLPISLSGGGGLRKTGPGRLTLSGTNSYSGDTTIAAGAGDWRLRRHSLRGG